MRILGIDQSLTATGLAIIDGGAFDVLDVVKTRETGHARLAIIKARVLDVARTADVVAMELPALSMRNSAATGALFGLKELLAHALWEIGKEPILVNPTHRAKYVTGSGAASKDQVMLAAARRYPDERLVENNIIDAAIIAAMVARIVGEPVEDASVALTASHLDVLSKVVMPGQFEGLIAPEGVEDRAWRSVEARVSKPVYVTLRSLEDASPEYAHALIDYAAERGYEVYRNQQWAACLRRLEQPSHTCGAKSCLGEWATPSDWGHRVLLRSTDGGHWAILSQDAAEHGLPAPVGMGLRAHLHTSANVLALA